MDRSDDPLAHAIRPPADESPQQRIRRIREEQEALRHSEEIDKELNRERAESKKHRPGIRVLLLGTSLDIHDADQYILRFQLERPLRVWKVYNAEEFSVGVHA